MRSTLYWITAFFVAVLAASAAGRPVEGSAGWMVDSGAPLLAVTDPVRSVLLGVGILAMAFTYRHAWEGFRRR